MKALLVRLSAIGDVVHTLPVLAALRAQGWECGWAVEPAARPLLTGTTLLAHVEPVPAARAPHLADARQAVRCLRSRGYSCALDLQGLWKSALWARLSGARAIGYAGAWRREPLSAWLLHEQATAVGPLTHVIDKNLALLRVLGIDAVGQRTFPLPPTASEAAAVREQLQAASIPSQYVVLNPGGGWASKLWPAERFGALAQALRERGLASVVSWGPGEETLADRVVAASAGAAVRCFPTTLLEFAELARGARLVVAADTGPLHLACAVGAPVVGLFGPTDPARNGPFSPQDVTVRRTPVCAPCHRRACRDHAGVMEAIEVREVLAAVDRRLLAVPAPAGALAV